MDTSGKGITREESTRLRAERIAVAAKLYAEAKNAPEPRSQTDIYKEISEKIGVSPFSVMQYVHTAFRRTSAYKVVPTHVRQGLVINGERYLTPWEVAKLLEVSASTVHSWNKQELGPKASIMRINGLDNFLFKLSDVQEWRSTVEPLRDTRGRLHYYRGNGQARVKSKSNGSGSGTPIKPEDVGVVGKAIINAERTVRMGQKNIPVKKALKTLGAQDDPESVPQHEELNERVLATKEPKVKVQRKVKRKMPKFKSKSEIKRVATQTGLHFDERMVDDDGKVRTIRKAARYIGINASYFTAAIYGRVPGYSARSNVCSIPHQKVSSILVFDPAVLRDWRVNVYHQPNPVRQAGVQKAWKTRLNAQQKPAVVVKESGTRRRPKRYAKHSKAECLKEMREQLLKMRQGSMTRKRWMRISTTGRRYDKFFKGFKSFHDFMMAALREKRQRRAKPASGYHDLSAQRYSTTSNRVRIEPSKGRIERPDVQPVPDPDRERIYGSAYGGGGSGDVPSPTPAQQEARALLDQAQRSQQQARALLDQAQSAMVSKRKPWWKVW